MKAIVFAQMLLAGSLALAAEKATNGPPRVAAAPPAEPTGPAMPDVPKEGDADVTVITSEKLTFDYQEKYALFEKEVVVSDPQLQLTSDRLLVKFDDEGRANLIKAQGHVRMRQQDKTAQAQIASYEVTTGKIVLEGNPQVERGRDVLTGDKITFWRDQNRMICEPGARLVIYPQSGPGGAKDLLMGE